MKNLAIALALAAVGCANYMKVEVEGRVVDELGRPVAGAQVTTAPWSDPALAFGPRRFVVCDEEGRFSATLPRSSAGGQALLANDATQGGYVVFSGDKATGLEIVLHRLVPVRAELNEEGIPEPYRFPFRFVYASTGEPHHGILVHRYERDALGPFTFNLPPGTYQLMAPGPGKPVVRTFEVPGDAKEVDLGKIPLEPYKFQALHGKPAPDLRIGDARGVSKNFKLSDLRGKWVVLYFWNHRMDMNRHFLPAYAELYERKDVRDQLEIIVVHCSDDVVTVADYDRMAWDESLPKFSMPLVIDDVEKTFEAYGLERGPQFRSGPSEVLIDPSGNVAGHGHKGFMKLMEVLGEKRK